MLTYTPCLMPYKVLSGSLNSTFTQRATWLSFFFLSLVQRGLTVNVLSEESEDILSTIMGKGKSGCAGIGSMTWTWVRCRICLDPCPIYFKTRIQVRKKLHPLSWLESDDCQAVVATGQLGSPTLRTVLYLSWILKLKVEEKSRHTIFSCLFVSP